MTWSPSPRRSVRRPAPGERPRPAPVGPPARAPAARGLPARGGPGPRLTTAENGKPLKWARAEVGRAVSTFRWAAEEARRFSGELQRLDTDAAATGRLAVVRRFPRGPVLGIAPFNFPLDLVAPKLAPALAGRTPARGQTGPPQPGNGDAPG